MNKISEQFKARVASERAFVRELETVSSALAVWAQEQIAKGWTIADVKLVIKNAMTICNRD